MDLLETLRDLILYLGLMSPACFEQIIVNLDLFSGDAACLKLAISKALGLAIVVGSSLVKLPQVLKIAASGSGEGISFTGVLLELVAVTFSGAYSYASGFPFSTYGESVFLALQQSLVGVLVVLFSSGGLSAGLFGAIYAGAAYAMLQPTLFPVSVLWYAQATNIPMILLGKLIQIMTNFRNGHTGQLSAITSFLLALGAIARIFTSIQETGDNLVIMTFVLSSLLNSIIALQVILYWNVSPTSQLKKSQ